MIHTLNKGYDQAAYDQLPLEIHSEKFLDWLVDRKICTANWYKSWQEVRERVKSSLVSGELPKEIAAAVAKEEEELEVTYYDCLQVVASLKSKETFAETNILGQYTSPLLNNWLQITKSYEKDKIYLAEGASILHRLSGHNIPNLRKEMNSMQNLLKEMQQKDVEYRSNVTAHQKKYEMACSELGIAGQNVKMELQQLLEEGLPQLLSPILSSLRQPAMEQAFQFYDNFCDFLEKASNSGKGNIDKTSRLPILKSLYYNDLSDSMLLEDVKNSESWTIVESEDAQIVPSPAGNRDVEEVEGNWDITIESSSFDNFDIQLEAAGELKENLSNDHSALLNLNIRTQFLDNLYELKYFSSQRLVEMNQLDTIGLAIIQSAPSTIQSQSRETIQGYLDQVTVCIQSLENSRTRQLLQMNGDLARLDRVADSVLQHQRNAEKLQRKLEANEIKRTKLLATIASKTALLSTLVDATKHLKKQLEESVAKLYNNRPVYIIGGASLI